MSTASVEVVFARNSLLWLYCKWSDAHFLLEKVGRKNFLKGGEGGGGGGGHTLGFPKKLTVAFCS